MKLFLISDNVDTQAGLRLAGIKGVVVHERDEVLHALETAAQDKEIGIIILTERLSKLVTAEMHSMKLKSELPLIAVIPDRHGTEQDGDRITRYIREAIGLKL
jgi:V/A-type H+-transporting ATPase subunit F